MWHRIQQYLIVLAIFCGFTALYIWSIGEPFYSTDALVMYEQSRALGLERQLHIAAIDLPQVSEGRGGHFYSKYDPGMPALAAHVVRFADAVAIESIANRYAVAAIFLMIIPAVAMSIAVTSVAIIAAQQSNSWRWGLLVALVSGMATAVWPYGRLFFAEAITAACLSLSFLLLVQPSPRKMRHTIAVGLLLGIAMMSRAHAAIFVLPVLIFLLTDSLEPVSRRQFMGVLPGVLMGGCVLLLHNWLRFEQVFDTGYSNESFRFYALPGMVGLLVSPGKSVFVYAPPLLLSGVLIPRYRRRFPDVARLLLMFTGIALLVYGAWWSWHGGWSWGPRFLVPLMPLWCLPWLVLPQKPQWIVFAVLCFTVGVAVQVMGTFIDVNPAYTVAFTGTDDTRDLSRYAIVHYDLQRNPLTSAIQRARQGQWEPQAIYHLQSTDLTADWVYGVPQAVERVLIVCAAWFVLILWRNPSWKD